jgi:hypothetical protein
MSSALSIPDHFRRQAGWCEHFGSPLYNHLLIRCANDYEQSDALRALLRGHETDADAWTLPLRLMGAAHRLVLEGKATRLAKFYPSVGGAVDLDPAWAAFVALLSEDQASLRVLIHNPVQTNDVGRSGSLLCGFALIARRTKLPLRLLEIGTSAGLNLCWDHYRYEWSNGSWGLTGSAVSLKNVFVAGAPLIPSQITIAERAGCDPCPVDIHTGSGLTTLLAYTWPDQVERIERTKAAVSIAREVPFTIDNSRAADWLEARLQQPVAGAATVIFHSVVWPYIAEPERERIRGLIQQSGARASHKSPLAWLRMEAEDNQLQIRLQIFPGLEEQVIATSQPHAPAVHWLLPEK